MKRWAALVCTFGLMALIFTLSAQVGDESGRLSSAALAAAEKTGASAFTPAFFSSYAYANIRKWAHVYLFAALGISMAATVHLWTRRPLAAKMALAALFCLLCAAGDELHQYFVPGRAALWQDIGVDALGFLPGILAVWLLLRWRAKRRPPMP